ncbi:MAG: multidrug efflux RND transporter permease subunit [Campylobacter sp.]|nr:multidrug efflux RND transporter permease subunit [Campylobacter sp.]
MFAKFSINRPIAAMVMSIIIVIAGLVCMKVLPVEDYPQLTPPEIIVSASYPGASAQTIADTVAAPLEEAINGVEDMIYMQSSSSSSGELTLTVTFKVGTDPQTALVNVNNKVKTAEPLLPEEVRRYGLNIFERSPSILQVVAFYDKSGSMGTVELNNYIKINVEDELKRVDGVGQAVLIGNKSYSMKVYLQPDKLIRHGITVPEIISVIREQNSQYAVGKFGERPTAGDNAFVFSVNPKGRLVTIEEFENIIIATNPNGSTLRIKDVAEVKLDGEKDVFTGSINGYDMAPVLVFMQNGANALATSEAVKARIAQIAETFPEGLEYQVPYDITDFINENVKEVAKTFFEALVLVCIVMYLFLGDLRATIIPMLAVPVSIVGAFAGMYLMGFSINSITLFALILAIGIVVDDAIIVIENVERILEEEPELTVKQATEKAMSEIFAPVVSIVLVLSAVFVPVSFMEGFVGIIQKQFALTLVVSVIISGFVALTLTPALCITLLKKERKEKWWFVKKFNDFFDWCTGIFTAGVAKILRHVIPSLVVVGILVFSAFTLLKTLPGGLVPDEDKGAVMVITTLPSAASLQRTIDNTNKIAQMVLQDENVEMIAIMAGYDILSGSLRENASIGFIKAKDWSLRTGEGTSTFDMAARYNAALAPDRESLTFVTNPPPIMGLSTTGGFEFFAENRTGKSFHDIQADMEKVAAIANQRPELTMVRTTLDTRFPQYDLKVDEDKAKMLGIDIDDIFDVLNANIAGYYVNDFNLLGKTYKVYLRAEANDRGQPSDLKKMFVKSSYGELVPLNSIVSLKKTLGADSLDRFNGFPAAKILGEPAPGYTSGDSIKAMSEVMHETFGSEYNIGWTGSAYQEVQASGTGAIAFVFGLIFVYLILAAQYERWLMPVAVLTAVPFSVLGSALFTWLRGLSSDVYFQIGLVLLIGLAAKNAILIVEFAMAERAKDETIFEAAVNAARLRFRPIVMTSIAFTLGVFPMVISTGAGAASRHSLGTGVVGGMIFASTVAIFFVPLFYYLLEKFSTWLKSSKKSKNDEKQATEIVVAQGREIQ